jgi:hypothetical protein
MTRSMLFVAGECNKRLDVKVRGLCVSSRGLSGVLSLPKAHVFNIEMLEGRREYER